MLALVTACAAEPEEVVNDRYWDYYQACEENKWGTAGDFLSEKARSLAEGVGICGFVHDSINLIELTRGGPEHSFLEDPDVKVVDATAQMIWIDDQGFITVVFFINVDGDWLIDEIRYST